MMLQLGPQTPAVLRAAATAVLMLHITGGTLGIASGATALMARKGGRVHRIAGDVFVVSMMVMAVIGAAVSPFLPQRANVVPGVLTFYLVATGWLTLRPRGGWVRTAELAALLVAAAAALAGLIFGRMAAAAPGGLLDGSEPSDFFVFAGLTAFAAVLDVRVLLMGVNGAHRLARHLWRMGVALLIGCISLFLGQPKVFPPALRGSAILFLPELLVIAALVFWLARTWLRRPASRSSPSQMGRGTAGTAVEGSRAKGAG